MTVRNAVRSAVTLTVVALLLGACRSDGGVGRRDALRSMRWTLDTFSHTHARDVERTGENLDDLAAWMDDEVSNPTRKMRRTMALYLEGNADR